MLHLVPLVAYVSLSTAALAPADMTFARDSVRAVVVELHEEAAKPMSLVDRRLRDLVVQQETWFAKEGRYGRNAYRAGQLREGDSTAYEQVEVEILYAGTVGWTALGAHPSARGKSCVIFVGARDRLPMIPRTHKEGRTADFEGIPACDPH